MWAPPRFELRISGIEFNHSTIKLSPSFFPWPIFSFHIFLHPLFWALTLTAVLTSPYGGNECWHDVVLAWPISSGYLLLLITLSLRGKIATVCLQKMALRSNSEIQWYFFVMLNAKVNRAWKTLGIIFAGSWIWPWVPTVDNFTK